MQNNQNNSFGAYGSMIGAMLIFGTIGIIRRYIPLSSGLLALTRAILGTLFLFLFIKISGRKFQHGIGKKKILLLALSGAAMGFNWILLFEAYRYTTVATATLCYYMQPTIVILLSPICFHEKLTLKKGICTAVALFGMICVSGIFNVDALQSSDIIGIVCGLGAACLYSACVIISKKVPMEDDYERTILLMISAVIVLTPYLLFTEDFTSIGFGAVSVILILVLGIVHTGFAYVLYFSSLNRLSAQSSAVIGYIDPIFALILSAVVLQENLSLWEIIGAVLIIGATLLSELHIAKRKSE